MEVEFLQSYLNIQKLRFAADAVIVDEESPHYASRKEQAKRRRDNASLFTIVSAAEEVAEPCQDSGAKIRIRKIGPTIN